MASENSPETILRLAQGFMECKIFHTAAELNLFTLLDQTPLSAGEVAARIPGEARALAVLLDALAAMGLLVKRGQTYECEGGVSRMLSEKSPQTILPMVLHMASLWKRWSRLTDIARAGNVSTTSSTLSGIRRASGIYRRHALHRRSHGREDREGRDPGGSRALLDVGGGSGTYTIACLRAVPEMRATLFDLPEVIEMARERLRNEGLLDRVTLVSGSFYLQEFP